jgi:uncharacterized protein (TIGR03066 family)
MRSFGIALSVGLALVVTCACSAEDKETNKEKVVGTWTAKPSQPEGQEMTYEFTKEGKFTMAFTVNGTPRKLEGTYEVITDRIKLKLRGATETETNKIKTLTDKEMVWQSKTETIEFTRVK